MEMINIKRNKDNEIYKIAIGNELNSHIILYPKFHIVFKRKTFFIKNDRTFEGKIYDLSFYNWKRLFEPYLKIKNINGLYSENEDYLLYNPIRRLLKINEEY